MKIISKILTLIAVSTSSLLTAQEEIIGEESKYENKSLLYRDSLIDVVANYKKKEDFKAKEKKTKRNVFYGYKTRRAFTRKGEGNRIELELFFVLKKYVQPDKSVAEIFWFDTRTKKITTKPLTDKNKMYALILHGPYKKMIGKQIVEQGQFYVGSKHGRWEILNKNNILIDKIKYYKGWPKESKIEYWDPETKLKVREAMPIVNGEEHGRYARFYKSGLPEIEGLYKNGNKTGIWVEFYDSKGQKKTEMRYSADSANPEILKTWDKKGKETFSKFPSKKQQKGKTNKKETPAEREDDEIFDEMEKEETELNNEPAQKEDDKTKNPK